MKDQPAAEGAISVFQPDLLLPLQFFTALRGRLQGDGQRRLMIAVLEDAIECFQKYADAKDNRSRQLGSEAEEWFLTDDPKWLYSFVNVCETLGIDPDFLRQGLLAWKAKQEGHQPSDESTESTPPDSGGKRGSLHAA